MSDYIRRADAIKAVCKAVCEDDVSIFPECDQIKYCDEIQALLALPSADAIPTVIRAKTFMRKEDFDKWAEGIKRQGENVICIPCDAEVVSADAVSREMYDTVCEEYNKLVHKAICGLCDENCEYERGNTCYKAREHNAIESLLPSSDAVQGEWKIDEYGIYHCPFCHAINNTVYKSFCPNCGARMKGGAK